MPGLLISVLIIVCVMTMFAYIFGAIAWKIYKRWLKRNDKFLENYYNPRNLNKSSFNLKCISLPFIQHLKVKIFENINKGINKGKTKML